MENLENNEQVDTVLANNSRIRDYLLETSKWGNFLSIVGYVGIGLMVILAIAVMVGMSVVSKFAGTGFPMGFLGLIYLFIAAIYYFPVTYLFRFSKAMKQGLESNDSLSLSKGFENLKSLFKFMGIFTIVIISIYALLLIVVLPVTLLFFR